MSLKTTSMSRYPTMTRKRFERTKNGLENGRGLGMGDYLHFWGQYIGHAQRLTEGRWYVLVPGIGGFGPEVLTDDQLWTLLSENRGEVELRRHHTPLPSGVEVLG